MSFWQKTLDILNKYRMWIFLLLGLAVGLTFVFTVPPWMHYDEPGHFEFAWLIANQPGLPDRDDYDQYMRRQVAASIMEVDIEGYTGMTTDPLVIDQPISIWLTHVGNHPPTYYLLASLPLLFFRHSDIAFQLILVRLVSLSLFLVFIWVSDRTGRTLFGEDHPLAWMLPLFLVTLPSFVDIMTAANNDVLAILAFSLFFWASVAILKKGLAPLRLGWLGGAVLLCIFAKNTAWLAVPLSLVLLLIAFFRDKKYSKWVWFGLGGLVFLAAASLLSWREGTPAHYYSENLAARPTAVQVVNWELGETVIAQENQENDWQKFYQLLSTKDTRSMATNTVTFGAWIWADVPTRIKPPGIQQGLTIEPLLTSVPVPTRDRIPILGITDRNLASPIDIKFSAEDIELSTIPEFYVFKAVVPPMGDNITWVYFHPATDDGNRVYWDGIVLAIGDFSNSGLPVFEGEDASGGEWGGARFDNIIRNASGERSWPVFAGWVRKLLPERTFLTPSDILSVFDFQATALYSEYTVERLFRTFWAVFGWANVPMFGQKPYRFFMVLSLVTMIGVVLSLVRKAFSHSLIDFLLVLAVVLLQATVVFVRGVGTWFMQTYIPVARYFYPAVIPIGVVITTGLIELLHDLQGFIRKPKWIVPVLFIALQLGIILWAILSIKAFYRL